MTRSRTVASMTLAGALALAGDASGAQQKGGQVKREKPAIVLITDGGQCPHFTGPLTEKLKKNEEALAWQIWNFCRYDQKVLFCVYLDKKLKNPFDPCTPDPGVRDIEKTFEVAGKGGKAELSCLATGDTKNYVKVVFTGTDVPDTGCPNVEPKDHGNRAEIRTHRLDIEIIP